MEELKKSWAGAWMVNLHLVCPGYSPFTSPDPPCVLRGWLAWPYSWTFYWVWLNWTHLGYMRAGRNWSWGIWSLANLLMYLRLAMTVFFYLQLQLISKYSVLGFTSIPFRLLCQFLLLSLGLRLTSLVTITIQKVIFHPLLISINPTHILFKSHFTEVSSVIPYECAWSFSLELLLP